MLKLKLTRIARKKGYTIGRLYLNVLTDEGQESWQKLCDTLEPSGATSKGRSLELPQNSQPSACHFAAQKKVLPLNARMNVITIQASKRLSKCSFLYRQTLSTLFTGSSFLMIQTKRWPSSNKIESSVASTTRTAYSRFCVPAPEFAHKHTGSPRARAGTHTLDSR